MQPDSETEMRPRGDQAPPTCMCSGWGFLEKVKVRVQAPDSTSQVLHVLSPDTVKSCLPSELQQTYVVEYLYLVHKISRNNITL